MARDPQTLPLLEVSDQQRERYQQQAKKCPIPFLYKALQLMNQCDINYRQSSNKRLLVELTLIEIAQITQPDEGAGSGRKPRRLKSLFKQLIQQAQPKQAAPQVAAAKPVASTPRVTKSTTTTTSKPAATTKPTEATEPAATSEPTVTKPTTATTTYNAASRPQLKAKIGFSWNNKQDKINTKGKMHIIPGTLDPNDPNASCRGDEEAFDQQELELQWMSMCNRMPQHLSGVATRMKNMTPVITQFPNVELTVENQLAKDQIEDIKGNIVSTLKTYLHNKSINFTVRVAEHHEQVRILTRREQYELMAKENPSIGKLRDLLDLELA